MYADRLEDESASRGTMNNRLNGGSRDISSRLGQSTGKRQRQDDKWEHDLYKNDNPRVSNRNFDPRDLRSKLQKKQRVSQSGRETGSGVQDLREKLSGTVNPAPSPWNTNSIKAKPQVTKPVTKSVAVEAPEQEARKAANPASRKKSQPKADTSVDSFLESLGLEKYIINFQAEEVDMAALLHMTDDDLKAMGIPMGPRKKITLALESKR